MQKSANLVRVQAFCDVLTIEGDYYPLFIEEEYPLEVLVALGHFNQEDICNQLEEQLNHMYESNGLYLGMSEVSFNCIVPSIEDITLTGNEFIPKLRGLYGRTT